MKNIIFGFLVLVIVGFFVYPKFNKKIEDKKPAKLLSKISISVPPVSPLLLINQVIKSQKLDEKYGYKLDIVVTQPQDSAPSVLTNKAQMTYLAPTDIMALNKNGKRLRMIEFGLKVFCPFIAKDSFEGALEGRNVAVLKKPNGAYAMLEQSMKNDSKDLMTYFNVTETDILSLPVLVARGDVEVSNICNIISITKLLSQDKFKIVDSTEDMIKKQENLGNLPFVGIVALESWIKDNSDLAKSYLSSQKEALKYLENNFEDHAKTELFKKTFNLSENETNKLISLIKEHNYFSFPTWDKSIEDIKKFTKDDFDNSSFTVLK